MQIDSIELFHVALPLCREIPTPAGPVQTLETVIAGMRCGEAIGWGEGSPGNAPRENAEWSAGTFACLRDWLAPSLLGREINSGDALQERLAPFRGNRFAKSALDSAWWDLHARMSDKPLHALLETKREGVEVGIGFDQMESIDDFLAAIRGAFDAGYARVELKLRPGWDLQMLNFVRQEFPTQTIHADVEGALRLENAEILYRIDDFALAMVEQPLPPDDLVGHAMIQEAIRTPISLDEAITTPEQADMALELKSGQFINVKPGRLGGITPSVAVHDACHNAHIPCWVGAVPQSAVGARAGLALAAKANFTYPADYLPPGTLFEHDLAEPPEAVRDDQDGLLCVPLWSEPGIGVEPDRGRLEELSLARATIDEG